MSGSLGGYQREEYQEEEKMEDRESNDYRPWLRT